MSRPSRAPRPFAPLPSRWSPGTGPCRAPVWVFLAVLWLPSAHAEPGPLEACYLRALAGADPATTVAQIRASCEQPAAAAPTEQLETVAIPEEPAPVASFTQQIAAERQSLDRDYGLTAHNPNYLLAYSLRNDPNRDDAEGGELDEQEAVLQVSVKFPLWRRVLGTNNDLLFSYTSRSWFQAYNSALSKPFRETNYEPEIFIRHYGGPRLPFGVKLAGWDIGYNHQSNGRSEPESRSWDRLMARLALDLPASLSLQLRAWHRFEEDAGDDDNPDIHHYLGYGDLRAIWTPNRNTFTAMFRPGTRENGFELTWSYPINNHFRLYTQYYNGYGESLIDYDQKVERFGIGFAINDYLQARP
jgi:phospholipase A1